LGVSLRPNEETAVRNYRSSVTCAGDFLSIRATGSQ
jgi:hypothetical protein